MSISYTIQKCNSGFVGKTNQYPRHFDQVLAIYTKKISADVCLLCLDFEIFTLVGTNGSSQDNEGDCIDMFMVNVILNANMKQERVCTAIVINFFCRPTLAKPCP